MAAVLHSVAVGAELVLAAVLTLLAWKAYSRVRARRMAMLGLAFAAFLVEGIVLAFALLTTRLALDTGVAVALLLQAGALLVIYVGVLRP